MSASKNGIAANELRRTLGVSQRTAWLMLDAGPGGDAACRPVAETVRGDHPLWPTRRYIGGDPRKRHGRGRSPRPHDGPVRIDHPVRPIGRAARRTRRPVLCLVSAESGRGPLTRWSHGVDGPTRCGKAMARSRWTWRVRLLWTRTRAGLVPPCSAASSSDHHDGRPLRTGRIRQGPSGEGTNQLERATSRQLKSGPSTGTHHAREQGAPGALRGRVRLPLLDVQVELIRPA